MFIVGIDIAKRSHEAIIIAEDGQVVRKAFSFRNNCTGYNLLLEQVRRLTLVKSQIVFAMESTAHYWLALYARLLKDGYAVMVLNPIQSHSLRELYIRKAKTDARDSLIIADLVRFGRCKASNVPQDKILALRELCRSRAYLVDMAADLKRKLIALLDRIFPEYEFLFDSVFTWIIIVPIAFLLAHFTGLGIVSVYFLVQATELIKVVIGYFMVRSNVWLVQMV